MNCKICNSEKVLAAGYGITLVDCEGNSKDMVDVTGTMPVCQECFDAITAQLQSAVSGISFKDGGITVECPPGP